MRLDVATDGHVQAAYAEAPGHRLPLPLQLSPALKAEYFDVRSSQLRSPKGTTAHVAAKRRSDAAAILLP